VSSKQIITIVHGDMEELDSSIIEAEKTLFREVAIDEMGWPAEELIQDIVAGKQASSHEFIVIIEKEVVGATKVICSRPYPVESPFPEMTSRINEDGKTVEVALTAVKKSVRGDLSIMLHLYRALYHWSKREGISAWYSVQEKQVTRLYRRIGLPFRELAEGRLYWCGVSYPCRLVLSEAEEQVKTSNSTLWKFFQQESNGSQ
jgi:hypothetical protein